MSRIIRIVLFIVHLHARKLFKRFKTKMFLLLCIKPNKFQVSCQRTDLERQASFSFLKKCLKSKQNCLIFQMQFTPQVKVS